MKSMKNMQSTVKNRYLTNIAITEKDYIDFLDHHPNNTYETNSYNHIQKKRVDSENVLFVIDQIYKELENWNKNLPNDQKGLVIDTRYKIHCQQGIRSPDIGFLNNGQMRIQEKQNEKEKHYHHKKKRQTLSKLKPSFVVEVISHSNQLINAKERFNSIWISNGCKNGWIIDTQNFIVYQLTSTVNNTWNNGDKWESLDKLSNVSELTGFEISFKQLLSNYKSNF